MKRGLRPAISSGSRPTSGPKAGSAWTMIGPGRSVAASVMTMPTARPRPKARIGSTGVMGGGRRSGETSADGCERSRVDLPGGLRRATPRGRAHTARPSRPSSCGTIRCRPPPVAQCTQAASRPSAPDAAEPEHASPTSRMDDPIGDAPPACGSARASDADSDSARSRTGGERPRRRPPAGRAIPGGLPRSPRCAPAPQDEGADGASGRTGSRTGDAFSGRFPPSGRTRRRPARRRGRPARSRHRPRPWRAAARPGRRSRPRRGCAGPGAVRIG